MTKYLFNSFSNDKKFDFNSISEAQVNNYFIENY